MTEKELKIKIIEGLRISYRRLVEEHRSKNQPLIFSENGVVQYVDPHSVQM